MIGAAARALLVLLWLPLAAGAAFACICSPPRTAAEKAAYFREVMDGADAVFAGIVVGVADEVAPCPVTSPPMTGTCTDTLYDIWVLEVGKGDVKGVTRVAVRGHSFWTGWGPGSYAKVIAYKDGDELQTSGMGMCGYCGPALLLNFGGPVPPWKISLIYGLPLLLVVGGIVFVTLWWAGYRWPRRPAPPTS